MHTEELLSEIHKSLIRNSNLINMINVSDIRNLIYLDLQCRRQLFPAAQFDKVEEFFEVILSEIDNAVQKHNIFSLIKNIEELLSHIKVLPDAEYVSDFIEQANMDHLRLEHICRKTIYVIGDSHVNFFSGNEELSFIPVGNGINTCKQVGELPVSIFHMGPCLAYNSNTYGTTSGFREKLDYLLNNIIESNAEIMFVMGEIDIRVHVFKQCMKRACSYEDVVNEIVDHYLDMMKDINRQGYQALCFGPIASQSDYVPVDKMFVKSGSEVERNKATSYFTRILSEKCKDENIKFISIFDHMITEDWHTKAELLSSDGCHLGQSSIDLVKNEFGKAGLDIQ